MWRPLLLHQVRGDEQGVSSGRRQVAGEVQHLILEAVSHGMRVLFVLKNVLEVSFVSWLVSLRIRRSIREIAYDGKTESCCLAAIVKLTSLAERRTRKTPTI